MKYCAKCQVEYPDDMAFCSYCGTPLQPKIEERVCPACGKVVHADNLRFCPYCGHGFASTETEVQRPHDVNIKNNYVKAQPLKREDPPTTTPLSSNEQGNVCPSCHSVIYAKNIKTCPYCGASLFPPEVNAKKNYVKTQPIKQEKETSVHETGKSAINESVNTISNNSISNNSESEANSSTGLLQFIIWCVAALVINGFIFNIFLVNISSALILFVAWSTIKGCYKSSRILPLIAAVLIALITIGGLGILKSAGKASLRRQYGQQSSVLIVNDMAFLK